MQASDQPDPLHVVHIYTPNIRQSAMTDKVLVRTTDYIRIARVTDDGRCVCVGVGVKVYL